MPRDQKHEILLRLLRGSPVEAIDYDWPGTARLGGHALAPYLASRLEQAGVWERVPTRVREQLTAVRRANTMAHLLRMRALRSGLAALESGGVPVVVLKGIALAHLVYPDPALRPMQDVDLWVPPDRLDQAADALRRAGFQFPRRTYEGLWTPGERTGDVDRALELPGTPILFELHGSLPSWTGLPSAVRDTAWARAQPTRLGDLSVRVLAPEDMLLHVGLHVSRRHMFRSGLLGLLDLKLLLERWRDTWEWPTLIDDYERLGIGHWMRLALWMAHELLDAPVPLEVFQRLPEPGASAEIARLAEDQVWNTGASLPHALEQLVGAHPRGGRLGWVRDRLLTYVRGRPSEAGRRLWFDVALKLPRYARLWIRGELRGRRMREHVRLARARHQLEALMIAAGRAPDAPSH